MRKLIGIIATVPLMACQNADSTAHDHDSELRSAANGINCDVNYDQLNAAPLAGITIDDRGIRPAEKIRHLNELSTMPLEFLDVMRGGVSIHLTAGGVTEFPKFDHLKGVVPRGWEATGITWDKIPGTAWEGGLYLGDSALGNNAISLAIHEATHAVDQIINIIQKAEFLEAYNQDKYSPHPTDRGAAYRLNYPEEYLAMAVEGYHCSAATRRELQALYPRAHDFVEQKLPVILKNGIAPVAIPSNL